MRNSNLFESLTALGLKDLATESLSLEKFAQSKTLFSTERTVLSTVRDIIEKCIETSISEPVLEQISLPPFFIETAQKSIRYQGEVLSGFSKKDILTYAIPNFLKTFTSKYMENRLLFLVGSEYRNYENIKVFIEELANNLFKKYNEILNTKVSKKDIDILKKTTKIRRDDIETGIRHLESFASQISLLNSYLVNTYLPSLDVWIEEANSRSETESALYLSRMQNTLKQPALNFDTLKREVQEDVEAHLNISSEDFNFIIESIQNYVVNPFTRFKESNTIQQFIKAAINPDEKNLELDELEDENIDEKLGDYGEKLLGKYRFEASTFETSSKDILALLRRIKNLRTTVTDSKGKLYSPNLIAATQIYLINEWKARYAALLVMATNAFIRNRYAAEEIDHPTTLFIENTNKKSRIIEEEAIYKLNKVINIL